MYYKMYALWKSYFQRKVLSEAMDVLSDMDELQIRQCLAMMKAMKSVSVEK